MKKLCKKLMILPISILFMACSTADDLTEEWIKVRAIETPKPGSAGSLDFSNYISIGNSIAAGFADYALYTESQENSFPNLLAGQFAMVDANVVFNQPDINSANGFNSAFSTVANNVIAGRTELSLSLLASVPTTGELITDFTGDKSTLNNFAVPGLRLANLETAGYGVRNAYFKRFADDPSTSSVLGDALEVDRSFFSFWLGSNDCLVYARSGGQGEAPLVTYDEMAFGKALSSALGKLTANKTHGVVLDISPIVTLPFFQAVTWDAIELDNATATRLNTSLEAVNGAIKAAAGFTDTNERLISYTAGANPILVHDEELDDLGPFFDNLVTAGQLTMEQRASLVPYEQSRPLVKGELVLLSAAALLNTEADGDNTERNTPIGIVIPLGFSFMNPANSNGDRYFLNTEEQSNIVTARATYNRVISATVNELNNNGADIALVTIQPSLVDVLGLDVATATKLLLPTGSADGVQGIDIEGITLTPDFSPNGVFSTDGIHPNSRGHGIVANLIIDAINARWGSSIPKIDVLSLRGTIFQP
ncbi:MAG: hypothetical protein GDA37_12220 [Ekhidna sp.]|nr:hypothetical protein [Ekhidna sp.]